MRTFSENPQFLATAFCLSVVALGGAGALTGCGSGGANNTPAPVTAASGASASYAGRSYTVDNIALSDGRTGSLALQVSSGNTVAGVLKLTNPTDTVGLTGTVTPATGAFTLRGNLTRAAATSAATDTATRASGDPVTATGTLPSGNSDGNLTLTVAGQSVNAALRGLGATPSPNPSASGSPGASPSPSGSATPNPTPSGNPTPNPTPSPTTGPGSGSGTLGEYYNAFSSSVNDTFNFKYTSTTTLSPDPNGDSDSSSGQNTIKGPLDIFGVPNTGQKTTVTINLPVSGSKTVTREEVINSANGKVVSYVYYVENASGRADYGSDDLSSITGAVTSSTRYEGNTFIPYTLSPGQSASTSYTDYETDYDANGAVSNQYSYAEQDKLTFVGIETVTVAAGTYSSVAHLRSESTYTLPASGGTPAQPNSDSADLYFSKYVGRIKAVFHNVTQNNPGTDPNGNPFIYTDTFDGTNELASATVNGTNYPPGRGVTTFGRIGPAFGKALPKRSFLYRHGVR